MRIAIAYFNRLAAGLLILVCASASGQAPRQLQPTSGELGSTMTFEELGAKPTQASDQAVASLEVRPAAEPAPALKYRFNPSIRELKPGSALLHFSRAILMLKNLPIDLRRKVDVGPDEPAPSPAEVQSLLSAAAPMFNEIHELAISEDFTWDHRMRDLRGSEVWSYLLPDVQEGRTLARLLRRRIDDQLARNDFEGAMRSIGDGYRLAEFMSSGEILIQQLVALAVKEIIRDAAQTAITKPGCPNLYWALASVPGDAVQMQRAVEFELSAFDRVFEMLPEAESRVGNEQYWQTRLQDLLASMREVSETSDDLSFSVTVAAMMTSPLAKQQLIEAGWKKEDVEAMSPIRALFINARRELRYWADQFVKGSLLEYPMSVAINDRVTQEFKRWSAENRYTSLGASTASLLFPPVDSVRTEGVRQQYQHNRLMALEALRMHAAHHQGQLPKSLADLNPVPAPLNPFNNEPFEYTAKVNDDGISVELSGEVPPQYKSFKQLNVTFKDTTLAP